MPLTGWPRNTLAVSLGGRNIVSVNKRALALGKARMTTEVSEVDAATQIVSCGIPLPGLDVKIVDPEQHVRSEDRSYRRNFGLPEEVSAWLLEQSGTDAEAVSGATGGRQSL